MVELDVLRRSPPRGRGGYVKRWRLREEVVSSLGSHRQMVDG